MSDQSYAVIVRHIRLSLAIAKVPLCLLVSFSALFGYVFAAEELSLQAFIVSGAVFFLSCGGASLNSYQERYRDGLMSRTRNRPLVQKQPSDIVAVLQGIFLVAAGLTTIFLLGGFFPFLAGLSGILLYNFVYTRLKPLSLYAIIPGAVCGALPPYIGWLAAGADPFSLEAFLPVMLLFFYQIPHFFLVLLRYKSDYAGNVAPNMLRYLSEQSLRRIFLPWVTALATTMITFSIVPTDLGSWEKLIIVGNSVILISLFYYQMLFKSHPDYTLLFRYLNLSLFLLMLTVCVGLSKKML
ncbi:MAG: UbiA family prenyltransferase [Desulfopila sp.]|jgi:protoheme IX farnesyltransferase|nr:UbiA family prenyltransferase [Desulfopila sp.]